MFIDTTHFIYDNKFRYQAREIEKSKLSFFFKKKKHSQETTIIHWAQTSTSSNLQFPSPYLIRFGYEETFVSIIINCSRLRDFWRIITLDCWHLYSVYHNNDILLINCLRSESNFVHSDTHLGFKESVISKCVQSNIVFLSINSLQTKYWI